MYIDNTWYGDRFILSKYCKIKDKPAFASIQHGHNVVNNKNIGKRKISATPWLVWNNKIAKHCLKNGYKNIVPIGSVFLYLNKINKFKDVKPRGTLVFPLLSQPEEKNNTNYLKLIEFLKKNLPSPYTISVGISDFKTLTKNYNKTKEVNFVTWGYRGNKNYLKKLLKNIKTHKEIFCIYPGSALIYSLYLNKKVHLAKNLYLNGKNKKRINEIQKSLNVSIKDFKNYGLNVRNLNDKKNHLVSKKFLGEIYIKKPDELIKLLGWNNHFKKFLANFFSIIINLKEDLFNGFNYSNKRRKGIDFK